MSSATQSDVTTGTTGTLSVADALRQVADWLDEHPEITPQHAFLKMHADSREDLEVFAAALGDRAQEVERRYGNPIVEISGCFGGEDGMRVYADLPVAELAGAPVVMQYEPILPKRDDADGSES